MLGDEKQKTAHIPENLSLPSVQKFSLKNIIIKYSIILLLAELVSWWFLFYSWFSIPTHIPGTPINISGLILLFTLTIIIFLLQKESIKRKKTIALIHLIAVSGLVTFLAELAFQAIRFSTLVENSFDNKLYLTIRGVIIITLFSLVISLFIGLILKKRIQRIER